MWRCPAAQSRRQSSMATQVSIRRKPARQTGQRRSSPTGAPEPDLKRALVLAMELMAIPGRSGHESEVVKFITGRLRKAGAAPGLVKIDDANLRTPIGGDTGNLILSLPGTLRGPRRLLMAH